MGLCDHYFYADKNKFQIPLKSETITGENSGLSPSSKPPVNIDCIKLSETSMKLGFPLLLQHMETLFYVIFEAYNSLRDIQFFNFLTQR